MIERVSSNLTLFLKLVLPVAWAVFFGSFALAFFISDPADTPLLYNPWFKWSYLFGYITILGILYFSVGRLQRVEFGPDGVYVTNYFKTFRYQYTDIARIKENDFGLGLLVTIVLREKGYFGKSVRFLAARKNYQDYLEEHLNHFVHIK